MPWRRFYGRTKGIPKERDFFRVSNHLLKFSKEFWEKEWDHCSYVILYINQEENKVGFEPSKTADPGAIKVLGTKNGITQLAWSGFVKKNELHFDGPKDFRIQREGRFWVISLADNGREGS